MVISDGGLSLEWSVVRMVSRQGVCRERFHSDPIVGLQETGLKTSKVTLKHKKFHTVVQEKKLHGSVNKHFLLLGLNTPER